MKPQEFITELTRLKKKGLLSEEAWLNILASHTLVEFEKHLEKSIQKTNGKQIRSSNKN